MNHNASWINKILAHRYHLITLLNKKSITNIYLAHHILIDRLNTIKLLHSNTTHNPKLRNLFLRETRTINHINHPNIVEITDYNETPKTTYLIINYVTNEPLSHVLERDPLD
jgi:Serine/threonine protein kinase